MTADGYLDHFRENVLPHLRESSVQVAICPGPDEIDVKFCVELGAAIMLGKPIVVMVPPGRKCPATLQRVANAVIHKQEDLVGTIERLLQPNN